MLVRIYICRICKCTCVISLNNNMRFKLKNVKSETKVEMYVTFVIASSMHGSLCVSNGISVFVTNCISCYISLHYMNQPPGVTQGGHLSIKLHWT